MLLSIIVVRVVIGLLFSRGL